MDEAAQEVVAVNSLLSFEERRSIVLSFTEAYLRGAVKVRYWSPEGVGQVVDMRTGEPAPLNEIVDAKKGFHDLLQRACGIGDPKPDAVQVRQAIDWLFSYIVTLRAGEFLEGEFLTVPNVKERLDSLEAKVSNIEKLFEELQQRLKVQGA